ncbi:MAG TPA: hypothetical protein PLJ34_00840 [Hyphomicrobiales bacterium]|nr:hypothetical protein [Kaistiaceae bacterium]HQF29968.1 hypothetical protein [Hyphomicrobiales bacterium]
MSATIVMLLLTLAADGATHVSFGESDSVEACTARVAQISPILVKAGYTIVDSRCAPSDIKVEKYDRNAPKDAPRYDYRVVVTPDGFAAAPVGTDGCTPSETEKERVFCASSQQKPLD